MLQDIPDLKKRVFTWTSIYLSSWLVAATGRVDFASTSIGLLSTYCAGVPFETYWNILDLCPIKQVILYFVPQSRDPVQLRVIDMN